MGGVAMGVNGAGARTVEGGQALLRDGADVLAPILSDGAATYVPGLSERRAGATSYLHGGDKNAEARTSSTGAVTGTRSYDAFGGTLASTGWTGPAGYGGAFGYREDGTNFRLVGHRLYDPTAGRFLSRDPARDGGNWYVYCEGDPVNGADPEGLQFLDPPRRLSDLLRRPFDVRIPPDYGYPAPHLNLPGLYPPDGPPRLGNYPKPPKQPGDEPGWGDDRYKFTFRPTSMDVKLSLTLSDDDLSVKIGVKLGWDKLKYKALEATLVVKF